MNQSQGEEDIGKVAKRFYERDPSFPFCISNEDGQIVYKTPDADLFGIEGDLLRRPEEEAPRFLCILTRRLYLHALRDDVFAVDYKSGFRGVLPYYPPCLRPV